MSDNFSIINKSKHKLPSLSFDIIKQDILSENYILSLAFVNSKKSKELNKIYRNKDNPTNILSFPLSKNEGEIIICPEVVKKEAKNFDRTFVQFLGFLVIHGMLHLKGMEHSSRMEEAEKKYDQKYFYRGRHRLPENQSRGGRIFKGRKKS